jgi:XTP/dITP diphosphohydrolase
MHHLVLATRNRHKIREFAELLGNDFRLSDLTACQELGEVKESGQTFEENARLKAVTLSRHVPGLVLADDSGLEVDSLGGAPGIFSARYAGEGATDCHNRRKLLTALAALSGDGARTARFRCVLVLARRGEVLAVFHGSTAGEITKAEKCSGGFGYDPIFRPHGFAKTFAELSAGEKNAISHRGVAVAQLRKFLSRSLRG